jgi:hypothetical protein
MWRASIQTLAFISCLLPSTLLAVPRLVCPQPEFDFGEATDGRDVIASFVLRNEGDEPLQISNVLTQCGCTSVDLPTKVISPNEAIKLQATLSSKQMRGKVRKSLFVQSNDPQDAQRVLYITGMVIPTIDVSPVALDLGPVDKNVGATRTVQLTSHFPDRTFHVTDVVSENPNAVSVRYDEIEKGKTYQLVIDVAKQSISQEIKSSVRVKTDDEEWKEIRIPVTATLAEAIAISPSKLKVIGRTDGKGVTVYLTVTSIAGQPFRITSVEAPMRSIDVMLLPTGQSGYRIKLSNLVASDELANASVVVRTDVKEQPEMRVPIIIADSTPKQ